ncbi:hypothetical protein [Microbacterium sp. KNMS]
MLNNDRVIAAIRTGVPALVGLVLAQLIALVPAVGDALAWLDQAAGIEVARVLELVATAAVIVGYYATVRWLAKRWPWVEGFLGSTKTPVEYVTQAAPTAPAKTEQANLADGSAARARSDEPPFDKP